MKILLKISKFDKSSCHTTNINIESNHYGQSEETRPIQQINQNLNADGVKHGETCERMPHESLCVVMQNQSKCDLLSTVGGGGETELCIANPQEYMGLKYYTHKIPGIKIFYPQKYNLNTSILIYSIKQALRPKKILDRSLDPKKYQKHNF